jgi:type I restriction enzyme S subunit
MPRASWSDLADIEIEIPPLPEQKKIAEILSGIDTLANHLSNLYHKKQIALRGLSLSLLGIGNCHHSIRYESMPLGNCLTLSRGVDITKANMVPGPYPVISSSGVSGWHNEFTHNAEGVIVGRKGSIGNVHYAETAHWVHDTSLGVLDYKGNHKRYIYHMLKNLDLAKYGTASGSPSLNRNDVHPIIINLPTRADQMQVASILDAEEITCEKLGKKIFTIKQLKGALSADLLSGRKRVSV